MVIKQTNKQTLVYELGLHKYYIFVYTYSLFSWKLNYYIHVGFYDKL